MPCTFRVQVEYKSHMEAGATPEQLRRDGERLQELMQRQKALAHQYMMTQRGLMAAQVSRVWLNADLCYDVTLAGRLYDVFRSCGTDSHSPQGSRSATKVERTVVLAVTLVYSSWQAGLPLPGFPGMPGGMAAMPTVNGVASSAAPAPAAGPSPTALAAPTPAPAPSAVLTSPNPAAAAGTPTLKPQRSVCASPIFRSEASVLPFHQCCPPKSTPRH